MCVYFYTYTTFTFDWITRISSSAAVASIIHSLQLCVCNSHFRISVRCDVMMQPADFSLTFLLSIDGWELLVAISVIIAAMSHCLSACDTSRCVWVKLLMSDVLSIWATHRDEWNDMRNQSWEWFPILRPLLGLAQAIRSKSARSFNNEHHFNFCKTFYKLKFAYTNKCQ